MAVLINLGNRLRECLNDGKIALHPEHPPSRLPGLMSSGVLTVHGRLNLSYEEIQTSIEAHCKFTFDLHWREQNPSLRCGERWIRRNTEDQRLRANWHINPHGDLCYIHPGEWKDQIATVEASQGTAAAIATAAFLTINNARWLLYHHFEGYRRKLNDWPEAWPQWAHGVAGVREYERERQNGSNKKS